MHLTTSRLTLTSLQPEDWQLFRAVHEDRDTMRWVSDIPDEDDIRERFRQRLAPWQPGSFHMLCLVIRRRDSGKPSGYWVVRLNGSPPVRRRWDICCCIATVVRGLAVKRWKRCVRVCSTPIFSNSGRWW